MYKNVGVTGKKIIDEDGYEYLPHVSLKKNKKLQDAIGIKKREFTTKSPADIKRTILKIQILYLKNKLRYLLIIYIM